jgi:hypothetical protein
LILNLEENNLAGQERKKNIPTTFSQYNHIQNVEEKHLFRHFANLIKIRSAHLLPIIKFLPSIVAEKNATKNILEGRTDRQTQVKQYTPLDLRSRATKKKDRKLTVHLVLIRLALRRKIRKYDFCGV